MARSNPADDEDVRTVADKPTTAKTPLPCPGDVCTPDPIKTGQRPGHCIDAPEHDQELQRVYAWLMARPITALLRTAVDDAIRYVLDGARTWRFDLMATNVDTDERSSVGTKLQYHVIDQLELLKKPPLDTTIDGVPVEIKGTVGRSWMISLKGQCEITLMIKIDAQRYRFRALLMRAHRSWLIKGNQDLKRSPRSAALKKYALVVADWTNLPHEPLHRLTTDQLRVVFGRAGMRNRVTALFGFLPEIVMPRTTIETVGAGRKDPLRRAREAKDHILDEHGLVILVGTWRLEREAATRLGYDLGDDAWIAIPQIKLPQNGRPGAGV